MQVWDAALDLELHIGQSGRHGQLRELGSPVVAAVAVHRQCLEPWAPVQAAMCEGLDYSSRWGLNETGLTLRC